MSKSLGNVVEPETIIRQYGAEVLRLWVASVEFNEDVRMSETILTRLSEAYRKLRNSFRFTLGNLSGFNPETDSVRAAELLEIDRWILMRAADLVSKCRAWYDEFAFHKVYHAVYDFATVDLSSVYFDVLKDRLYTSATQSQARRSAQTALYRLTFALTRLLAPIIPFTTEEVWLSLKLPGSVHTAEFPTPEELVSGLSGEQRSRLANWDRLLPVRQEVLKKLEAARQEKAIGAPLEAAVRIRAVDSVFPLLLEYAADLPGLFIVSQVHLSNHAQSIPEGEQQGDAVEISVERAAGVKCERCWKYTTDTGANADFPTICAPCAHAVVEMTANV